MGVYFLKGQEAKEIHTDREIPISMNPEQITQYREQGMLPHKIVVGYKVQGEKYLETVSIVNAWYKIAQPKVEFTSK